MNLNLRVIIYIELLIKYKIIWQSQFELNQVFALFPSL